MIYYVSDLQDCVLFETVRFWYKKKRGREPLFGWLRCFYCVISKVLKIEIADGMES